MAFRLIDFECHECHAEQEALVDVPHGEERPRHRSALCVGCGNITEQDALIGMPARYMGETVCNPEMYGGQFDTMGMRELPRLPDLPGAQEYQAKVAERMRGVPNTASRAEKQAAFHDASHDAPSSADYATLFQSREYKAAEAERERIKKQNKQKRARASAMRRGENINMRRDKCAGDPNITA